MLGVSSSSVVWPCSAYVEEEEEEEHEFLVNQTIIDLYRLSTAT